VSGIDGFTKLCMHLNTDWSDSSASGHIFTNSNTTIDSTTKKFGAGSMRVASNGDHIYKGDSADWDFGSGDFTIDFWYNSGAAQGYCSFGNWAGAATTGFAAMTEFSWGYQFYNNVITFYYSSTGLWVSGNNVAGASNTADNTWHHLAVERHGNNLNIFSDGVLKATKDVTGVTLHNSTGNIWIGVDGSRYWDEIRISKGTARYGGVNFTPPNSEYTTGAAPDFPSNPSPAHNGTGDGADQKLTCYVSDPGSLPMDVEFFNADGDVSLGTDSGVASGGTAKILWEGLTPGNSYSWYAVADNGDATTKSPTWTFTAGERSWEWYISNDGTLRKYVDGVKTEQATDILKTFRTNVKVYGDIDCDSLQLYGVVNAGTAGDSADIYIHNGGGIWIYGPGDNFICGAICKDGAAEWQFENHVNIGTAGTTKNMYVWGDLTAGGYKTGAETGQTKSQTIVTDVRDNAGQMQKKTQVLTFTKGLLTAQAAESDWTDTTDV